MTERCRVAEAELANDVDWVEPNRPKAMFTGLYTFRKDDQALLIKYAEGVGFYCFFFFHHYFTTV